MNRQNVMKWCREFSEGRTDVHNEQSSGRLPLQEEVMTRFKGQAADFYDLSNIWTVPATMLKNKVMYRQFIHSVTFVN
jgi:hypothetical protein